jgi:hypothetical protein
MHDRHYENVLEMGAEDRMTYFVTTVCDSEEVFCLGRGDDVLTITHDESGRTAFPVWPHARLAAACAKGELEGAEPTSIDLEDFTSFCDRLESDGAIAAVMMHPEDESFVMIEPAALKRELEDWLEQAYDPDSQPRY